MDTKQDKKDLWVCLSIGLSTGLLFFVCFYEHIYSFLDVFIFVFGYIGISVGPVLCKKISLMLEEFEYGL